MYYDVNCGIPEKAKEVDCKAALTPSITLKSSKDLSRLDHIGIASISGEEELLLKACVKKNFFLINPLETKQFYKSDALIRAVVDHDKVFEIPLKPLLHSSFVFRAKIIRELRAFIKKCLKLKAKFVFTSRAETELDLKTERELIAIISQLGLTPQQAKFSLTVQSKRIFDEYVSD